MDRKRRRRRLAGRLIAVAFFAGVVILLADRARSIDWAAVGMALRSYQAPMLLQAVLLMMLGHLVFSAYDLIGRRYAGHHLPTRRVLAIAGVSYAFNLNLGAILGGMGFRYRLYSRQGLGSRQILRVLTLALATNWTGYLLVAGLVFVLVPPELPASWPVDVMAVRAAGFLLLALLTAWLAMCAFAKRRDWNFRQLHLRLPSLPMALAQLALSGLSWSMITVTIYSLMPDPLPLATVMGAYYLATLATLVIRIPGGLGVVEAVFLALLSPVYTEASVLAALLAWRAIWFLLPLAHAIPVCLLLETRWRADGAASERGIVSNAGAPRPTQ
ncbi:lysylphosphatidylglycerol synthase domain-containing protein [Solimonas sp. SE-A11]|uniref:lysylphosphatidylglycerol synthase domain-containing protein n=1 Tax=Solimonas sp. SE-A11 TaxID=3054954 RepID=UPI00259C9882|nr:lysylphosphatidylglycerol synthase domain-containing protein [Solimonas sp. SE-A11]MDM4768687.1 lysylphosphatidylglycerol synthase domain-containing protein [Solimonas sp. SE-A11]